MDLYSESGEVINDEKDIADVLVSFWRMVYQQHQTPLCNV